MTEAPRGAAVGCGQLALIFVLLFWLAIVPVGVALIADGVASDGTPAIWGSALPLAAAALLLVVPTLGVALIARRRAAARLIAGVAAALVGVAGYIVVDTVVRVLFPVVSGPSLHGEGAPEATLRGALLLLYTLTAVLWMPRLAGVERQSLAGWLALDRCRPAVLFVAVAAAALVTAPWPLTGALGDSLTSLSVAYQMATWTLPQVLFFWGLIYNLLATSVRQAWLVGLATWLIAALACIGGVLPTGEWGALTRMLYALPVGLLLAELRAREGGIYALLPAAFLAAVAPQLFADPRDALAQGIPEFQHIAANVAAVGIAASLGFILWVGRRALLAVRDRFRLPTWAHFGLAVLAAATCWAMWLGLYVFAGSPGFVNDGFLLILDEQADLGTIAIPPDAGREARIQTVVDALIAVADRTQPPVRAELDRLGVPYRPYYIINMIRVDGHRTLMRHFEDWPGVAQVLWNPNVRGYPRRWSEPYILGEEPQDNVGSNLLAIHADRAWELGVFGEGIVVAGQDTGYDWRHPALKAHYRGWDGVSVDHNTNWHDAWDGIAEAFDDDSHGTHTMGTVLGDDGAGERVGVAPGAQWIGCRNMRRGFGNPGAYAECTEFFLAPYPLGGDPFHDGDVALAPHVVNNSWGCPDFEGCEEDTLQPMVEAMRAAGIMMVVSAGNDGPACETADTPPARYDAVFSVGATDEMGSITGFSSRGPVGSLIKPDVTAPGESIRSSIPGGGYAYASGTSMAGPHVVGVIALLWSADPALQGDIAATEELICRTAEPQPVMAVCTTDEAVPEGPFASLFANPVCACGEVVGTPNNVFGCGVIDAGAAVEEVLWK